MAVLPGPLPDGRRSGGDEGLGSRLAYCQGLGKPYNRPGCKNPVCQNDILHWVNTLTLDSCFGLVGHHQQGAECDPVEGQPLNLRTCAQPLACRWKLSKISTLACVVTMTTSENETREKLLPTARDSKSRTVDLPARNWCVKMTSSIGLTLQHYCVQNIWATNGPHMGSPYAAHMQPICGPYVECFQKKPNFMWPICCLTYGNIWWKTNQHMGRASTYGKHIWADVVILALKVSTSEHMGSTWETYGEHTL